MSKTSNTDYTGYIPMDGGVDEYHDPAEINNNEFQSVKDVFVYNARLRKRPGSRIVVDSVLGKFRGAYEYITGDGEQIILFVAGNTLCKVNGTSYDIIAGGLADEDIHFHTQNGICYVNGATTQKKYDGTSFTNVGVPAPTVKPSVSKSGAGLTGSYAWVYTYVIEEDGVRKWESDPSPVSDSLSLSNEGATIEPSASADTRINARYIYRTTVSGAKYYYEGKISNNTEGVTFASGSVGDASLGDEVEYTHGQPLQAEFAAGGNSRQFWVKNDELYYSEIGRTVFYNEYVEKDRATETYLSFYKLPNNGKGTGIAPLYNRNSGFEDIYVFQEDSISVLQNGDPNYGLYSVRKNIGCNQHDSIAQYNDMLVFVTNRGSVGIVQGGQFVDISSRKINKTIEGAFELAKCRGEILFNHYYVLTIRDDSGKGYNNKTIVCDLRTIRVVQNNQADAKWWIWETDIDYWVSDSNEIVWGFDSRREKIYQFRLAYINDEISDGTYQTIEGKARTKNFNGRDLFTYIMPRLMSVDGKFQRPFKVQPYAWRSDKQESNTLEPIENAAVAGSTLIAGQPTTQVKNEIIAQFKPFGANKFSFEFTFDNDDNFLEVIGYQLTVKNFGRYKS